jgi:predicted  nucleic acid-binding Zn-ribbon protein
LILARFSRELRCCGSSADDLSRVADSTGEKAAVCSACGSLWIAAVMGCWDASLRVFLGTATRAQQRAHRAAVSRAEAANEAKATQDAERREKAAARARAATARREAARVAAAEAAAQQREHRARIAALYVQRAGRPVKLGDPRARRGR